MSAPGHPLSADEDELPTTRFFPDGPRGQAGEPVGRYAVYHCIATGGMAAIHVGRMVGAAGFARTVAVKRLHPQYAQDPDFVAMFLDEARLAARIVHPNVVSTLDVVAAKGELFLIMDYVAGESLANLAHEATRRGIRIPPRVTLSVVTGLLYGLHAAHEATSEGGEPLSIVHRDVSPQNVLVGVDGVARVLDFGVAKATWRNQTTREGQLKGKLSYMAPEQVKHETIDRRTDVYSAAVVLWETLTGRRLFSGDNPAGIVNDIMGAKVAAPSAVVPDLPVGLDAVVLRGLERDPSRRFQTAIEMARALEDVVAGATPAQVAECVRGIASAQLEQRAGRIAEIENGSDPAAATGGAAAASAAAPEGRRGRAALPTLIITKNDQGEPELTGGIGDEAPSVESAYASDPLSQSAGAHGSRRWVAVTVAVAAVLAVGVATLGLMRPSRSAAARTVAAASPAAEPPAGMDAPPLPAAAQPALAAPTPEPGPTAETRPRRRLGPPRPSGRSGGSRPVASESPLGRILDVRE